ncbi:MAG: MotA/TolQ/ExbB proton channel family protein [Pseudomonadales bacterium]|nr:MotA/TolQ/ExbB proton channel family protein [Pseudomonadales bacterium]
MNFIRKTALTFSAGFLCLFMQQVLAQQPAAAPAPAVPQMASSLDDLLKKVEEARLNETEEQKQREAQFRANVSQQQSLLNEMRQRRANEERISVDLESKYNENEIIKAQRDATLKERLGDLDELFGTIAGVVGDTRSNFEASLVSAQFPGREAFLDELAATATSDSDLPSIEELERLWFYLLQEMTESGRVSEFTANVAQPDGTQSEQAVVRIGSYNIVSNGQYLTFNPNTKRLSVLPRQPAGYTDTAVAIQNATSGFTTVGIDPTGPTGGSYLAALISSPNLQERVEQGGTVGNIIIALGIVALLFALERLFTLGMIGSKVSSQLKHPGKPNKNNPLGRVLMVYESDRTMDIETLELKLGEAILQETPKLEKFLTLLKIIATVAPLMGLLGTVTGMIQVFQAITLFGTGDPQIMAGGISGALVTTVLGLVVAIPTVLLHTLVKGRSDRIIHVLEEQATGIIARKSEAGESKA